MEYIKGENGYNLQQLRDAQKLLKDFNTTTTKKNQHITQLWELKKLMDTNLLDINRYLFDATYYYQWDNYKKAISVNATKKDLDRKLKRCIESLYNDLGRIIHDLF